MKSMMKKFFQLMFLSSLLIFAGVLNAFSCEINILPENPEKKIYELDETVILTVTITHDHRRCLHEGEEPEIKIRDLKVLGKTDFEKVETGVYEIKYKVKLTGEDAAILFYRECSKGGGEQAYYFQFSENE